MTRREGLAAATLLLILVSVPPSAGAPRHRDDRMAAFHQTIVATNEVVPATGITTYVWDRFTQTEAYGLVKVVVGAAGSGSGLPASEVRVRDVPGAVQASFRLGDLRVRTEICPLAIGRSEGSWEGAAAFAVSTDGRAPLKVRCGGGRLISFASPRAAWLQETAISGAGDTVEKAGDVWLLRSRAHPLVVAVRAPFLASLEPGVGGGCHLVADLPAGHGVIVIAFARTAERATQLACVDVTTARGAVARHYARLLRARVRTPESTLDAAFRAALITLEYNWLYPYGWTECIHHWYSLWHMQHSGAADWLGQRDRTSACLLAHVERLLPDGAVPQLSPGGWVHRDFGGSNQFFFWQVRHHWEHTADVGLAARLAPALDRALEQTWADNDPDGDGLLGWGQQIGNQEDYVSTPYDGATPTIEGINMLETRAAVARALGEAACWRACERRGKELRSSLRERLWLRDLGRFGFFRDPLGQIRLDGQYHTFAYPPIGRIVDPFDAWTSVRHLRDRLAGARGEVYCSNNFAWHAVGTWGMQAGAAQQPWAAWAFSATGLRNETFRPLLAAARWAMDANHRGAWPEISVEPTPAYFSPPAGLYVQAVVEALFGLAVDRPSGVLRVSPSFPDAWPSATLNLPEFRARFERQGRKLVYRVWSSEPLRRSLRWRMPPGFPRLVRVDGRRVAWSVEPGVGHVVLSVDAPRARLTTFEVDWASDPMRVRFAGSCAEGDALTIRANRGTLGPVKDPCGVSSGVVARSTREVAVRVATGLLRTYEGFGRLGQASFSRRTLFVECRGAHGVRWWHPIDLSVLPRTEVSGGRATPHRAGARVVLTIRNNTARHVSGKVWLLLAGFGVPAPVRLGPRRESPVRWTLPPHLLGLFCSGDNEARVQMPGGETFPVVVDASALHAGDGVLARWMAERLETVNLPPEALEEDTRWRDWRPWYAYGHWPWVGSRPPLEAVGDRGEVAGAGVPGLRFVTAGRRLAVCSRKVGRPSIRVNLNGRSYRKLYLLVAPFVDNHDVFAEVGRVSVRSTRGVVWSRVLRFPGDLDAWCPPEVVGQFCTAPADRPDRHGLLSRLGPAAGDWPEAKPPIFPQPAWWSRSRAVRTASSVMSIVEVDLRDVHAVECIELETLGSDPALGLVAIAGERAIGHGPLKGTPWMPPSDRVEARTLFGLQTAGDLEGWRCDGGAFTVEVVRGLTDAPTLNSLAASGEAATGSAASPAFLLDAPVLRFKLQGGRSQGPPPGDLHLALRDAVSGEVLATVSPPGSHVPAEVSLSVGRWMGRRVILELMDRNASPSYAWIGISDVRIGGR